MALVDLLKLNVAMQYVSGCKGHCREYIQDKISLSWDVTWETTG